jgi:threonine dehydratase
MNPTTLTIEDIRSAEQRIKDAVSKTPCIQRHTLSAMTGCDLAFKFTPV